MSSMLSFIIVGIGGFAGSISRFGLSVLCQRLPLEWPIGTLGANILGCLIIGIIAALSERAEVLSPAARLLFATGFCGGFTTMSSMIYETAQMLRSGDYFHASLYILVSFGASMIAFFCGFLFVRILIRNGGSLWS